MGSPLAPVLASIFMGFTDLSGYKFSSNQNKLKDKSDIQYIR